MPVYVCHAVRCGGWIVPEYAFCSWHWGRLPPYLREVVSIALVPGGRLSAYTAAEALELANIHLAVRDGYMRCDEARRRLGRIAASFRAGRG